ncbi:MAG: shikimate dehydrogenase [Actinobacteria bacterium]|nr:shikimate dehydrogenase [Actinomycetota bacterium]
MIKAAVLGSPISHSLSPVLHMAAYRALGIEGEYTAVEVKVGQLRDFLLSLDKSWTGFSLTMPLKEEALKIADEVEVLASLIQSANTLIRSPQGWRAATTDVRGFQEALLAHGVIEFTKVLIIGSGATARAAASAVDFEGREIQVLHRNPGREDAMRKAAPYSLIEFLPWSSILPRVDLMINTTPPGVADHFASQITRAPSGVFFEALYNPWPTKLLNHWRMRDAEVIDGLELLVYQGIDQVALMTGKSVNRAELAPILRDAGLMEINN